MTKTITRLVLAALLTLAIAACDDKGPVAELKAAEEAISAAKAAQVDSANTDLKQAEEAFAKAEQEINWQRMNATVKDYKTAKNLLAEAKRLGEKALSDHKAAQAAGSDTGKKVSKSDPPRIKS